VENPKYGCNGNDVLNSIVLKILRIKLHISEYGCLKITMYKEDCFKVGIQGSTWDNNIVGDNATEDSS
jgi:hypothetical protein